MEETSPEALQDLAHLIRIHSIESTSASKSGHPTTCSSCCEILSVLFFRVMRYNKNCPKDPSNDRFVLSKGHAAPALYACWVELGVITKEELLKLRHIDSDLEGHPTPRLKFIDVGTGSLGQGLAIACGMAHVGKYVDRAKFRVYCVLGDGECAEGSVWESVAFAVQYNLNNLCVVIDVNRLGQTGETMYGHCLYQYEKRLESYGFNCLCVDGHDICELIEAFQCAEQTKDRPTCIIAKTFKGKYFEGIENKPGWHGKPLGDKTKEIVASIKCRIKACGKPEFNVPKPCSTVCPVDLCNIKLCPPPDYKKGEMVATRTAYGTALAKLGKSNNRVVAFDADVSNSTFSEYIKKDLPDNFVECYIAEQNMVGVAVGAACRNRVCAFASTFAAFLTRAFDQIRMAAISKSNINLCGSHCGISIGHDGPSQMGLEDIAMFRTIPDCTVFYPSDAVSAERAVQLAANTKGVCYIRTTRSPTAVIHCNTMEFQVGRAVIVQKSPCDVALVIAAGITMEETMEANKKLCCDGIRTRIMDLFTIKPIDKEAIVCNAKECGCKILVIEDHYPEGGMGEAVLAAVADQKGIIVKIAAVEGLPKSGETKALLKRFRIDSTSIYDHVTKLVKGC
ncbi:unnamed protein product [Phyllotreta striolata]|uniref:transketolase n=1 Tax=Phyllotreta striolata TaxID=444603 RepID=A0A9P0DNW5_PHYSR|nr:unnamed protein product [Phyllotreta striolata]